jgi:hypothetical protein
VIDASKAVVIAVAGLASLYGAAVSGARAQAYYDNGSSADLYGNAACYSMISATGLGYPFGIGSRHSAIKAWQRQAWALYGSNFSWSRAEKPYIDCAPYLATIRCTASARPCS